MNNQEAEPSSATGPVALMKQLEATEGWKIRQRILFHSVSYRIFMGNYEELKNALEAYHNPDFALPLWSVTNRPQLDLFQTSIVRMLQNYVASAKSLVDHTRKFVRTYYAGTDFEKNYDSKVDEVFHNLFCAFIMDLRDYILHNGLPLTSVSLH